MPAHPGIPTRSAAGLAARDVFFEQFNDINFYVEDEDEENLYHEILARLFRGTQLTRIFPLGGKQRVLDHARDAANKTLRRPRIYIVDKDFDDLLGQKVPLPNLFYLRRYCIENFLLEEDAALQIVVESHPKMSRQALARSLRFSAFLENLISCSTELFRLFFLVQKYNLGLPNTGQPPDRFVRPKRRWLIDRRLVARYRSKVADALIAKGIIESVDGAGRLALGAFPRSGPRDANISGKFLLKLTHNYLSARMNVGQVGIDSLRYRLARNAKLRPLLELRRRVRLYLRH